ncbi:aldehyde dehydrogenase family protein [Microbacterium sp. LWH3-1.2]|uniref:aldehyde dehydrogenase family protein n=1 Tax=Microbacterium sp. LWH3-1.2 TaxID=3135256 RepID=UPI0034148A73
MSARVISLRSPADGTALGEVPITSEAEVREASRLAEATYRSGRWSRLAPRGRAAVLLRLADLMQRDLTLLARLDCEDAGKPITECLQNDVPSSIESIRWFAEAVDKQYGRTSSAGGDVLAFTEREPFGVVAAILPWNYPLAMAAWKVGPALAAGNSLILKPADATPRSVLHLADLAAEAGLPDGVLQVLPGDGPTTGAALADDPIIGALSFTGSTTTGRSILIASARSNLKRVSLEMGGKSPQILMDDALAFGDDLIDGMIESAFLTSGQNCTAGSRILVHESIHDAVVERFAAAAARLRVGHPADPATRLGPVIDARSAERILGAIDQSRREGATVVTGGREVGIAPGGHYLSPTVLTGIAPDAEITQQELFGPVVTIQSFRTRAEAIEHANDIPYGLAASVWTTRLDDALVLARGVEAGLISVGEYSEGDLTVPFGGWKQSGFGGAEKSLRAFEQWTREKSVWIRHRGA